MLFEYCLLTKEVTMESFVGVNEFYMSLLSTDSSNIYDNNVQSAFTNLLGKVCKLNENWVVGLAEIAFNKFTSPMSRLQQQEPSVKRKQTAETLISEEEDTDNEFSVEVIAPINRYRKRRHVSPDRIQDIQAKSITIQLRNGRAILLNSENLESIAYKKRDINFGKFLETLPEYIYPERYTEAEAKRQIKDEIFSIVTGRNWSLEKLYHKTADKEEFTLHIYMGSNISNNVILKYGEYESLEEFMELIILQLPQGNRNTKKLLELFNIFYIEYNKLEVLTNNNEKNTEVILKIPFDEFGATLSVDMKTITSPNKKIEFGDFLKTLAKNMQFNNDNEKTISETKQKILVSIQDYLRGKSLNLPFVPRIPKDNDTILNVPTDSKNSYATVLVPKEYNRFTELLNEIYSQIPFDLRNKELLKDMLGTFFVERTPPDYTQTPMPLEVHDLRSENQNSTATMTMTSADEKESTIMYVYTDLIKPRFIGNMQTRYLRIIPNANNERHIRFTHVEYCPVEVSHIQSVSILLTDGTGEKIKFIDSKVPTYVMLHFKKML